MAARNDSFLINLKLRRSSAAGEVHDIILEELIRAGNEKTEKDRVKVLRNGDTSVVRSLPFDAQAIRSIAVSPPYVGVVLNNGKVCRYRITGDRERLTESSIGKNLMQFFRLYAIK